MNTMMKDSERIDEAMDYLNQENSITTDESIAICSWILSDENKISFLKKAFPYISDKGNLRRAVMTFTMVDVRDRIHYMHPSLKRRAQFFQYFSAPASDNASRKRLVLESLRILDAPCEC